MIGIEGDKDVGERQLGHVPLARRVPLRKADSSCQARHIEQNIRRPADGIYDPFVDPGEYTKRGARKNRIQAAEKGLWWRSKSLQDAKGFTVFRNAGTDRLKMPKGGVYNDPLRVGVTQFAVNRKTAEVDGNQNCI